MARKLNKRQLTILDRYADCSHFDDLPIEARNALEDANDYETMWQDASRYLNDKYVTAQLSRDWMRG